MSCTSTIYTILLNEKYVGLWIWSKTRFLKDPDSGRRRPIARPADEWIRQERPELRIIDDPLWRTVRSPFEQIRELLVEKFRDAMPMPIVGAPTRSVNAHLDAAEHAHDERTRELKAEILSAGARGGEHRTLPRRW
jgi:hypothetical protein